MRVTALMTGRSALLPGGKRSAIRKHAVLGPVGIAKLGLDGDMQVDKRHHGGPEMAVHLYPMAHHDWWRKRIGDHTLLADPGAFGGNIAVDGVDETQVRIGERFRLGSAVVEISQPRMPCATIERRFERKGMVAAILESGRCGWYFRVIQEGEACAGDQLAAVPGTGCEFSVRDVFMAVADPASDCPRDLLEHLGALPELTMDWRQKAQLKASKLQT